MTTIVAVQTEDDVLLGWDSQATRSNEVMLMNEPKVFCRHGVVFAVAGTFRMLDLLYAAEFPEYDGSEARRWIIRTLVPEFQRVIAESGHAASLLDDEGFFSGATLVVVDGTAFVLDGLFSPTSTKDGIYTIGSGGDYARGALLAGATVRDAIEIAAGIDPFTGGAITTTTYNEMIIAEEYEDEVAA